MTLRPTDKRQYELQTTVHKTNQADDKKQAKWDTNF